MSFLDQVESGVKVQPYFLVLYGIEGVGKSTFASDAPKPLFLDVEGGTSRLNVHRLPQPKSYKEILAMLDELLANPRDYESFVFDSLDRTEPLVNADICHDARVTSIEDIPYGKGWKKIIERWNPLVDRLRKLREKMHVILIAHSKQKKRTEPLVNAEIDRHELKLYEDTAALFRESVDAVLFATSEVVTKTDGGKVRAYGEGERFLYTEQRPGFDAKNRYNLPFKMDLSWETFETHAKKSEPPSEAELTASLQGLLKNCNDLPMIEKVTKAMERDRGDVSKLMVLKNKVLTYLGDKK